MNPTDLETAAKLLFGSERFGFGWQRPLARALDVDDRLVRRWASGERSVPPWVPDKFAELAESRRRELAVLAEATKA